MIGEELVLVAIVGAAFLVALAVSFFVGKRHSKAGLSIIGGVWACFTGLMFFGMYNASGWDALGYVAFLIGVSAPAAVGGLIGSIVGWAKGGNDQNEQTSPRQGHTDTAAIPR